MRYALMVLIAVCCCGAVSHSQTADIATQTVSAGATVQVQVAGLVTNALTENSCSIGQFVAISNVTGGANGNVICTSTLFTDKLIGFATTAAAGSKTSPAPVSVLINIR